MKKVSLLFVFTLGILSPIMAQFTNLTPTTSDDSSVKMFVAHAFSDGRFEFEDLSIVYRRVGQSNPDEGTSWDYNKDANNQNQSNDPRLVPLGSDLVWNAYYVVFVTTENGSIIKVKLSGNAIVIQETHLPGNIPDEMGTFIYIEPTDAVHNWISAGINHRKQSETIVEIDRFASSQQQVQAFHDQFQDSIATFHDLNTWSNQLVLADWDKGHELSPCEQAILDVVLELSFSADFYNKDRTVKLLGDLAEAQENFRNNCAAPVVQ